MSGTQPEPQTIKITSTSESTNASNTTAWRSADHCEAVERDLSLLRWYAAETQFTRGTPPFKFKDVYAQDALVHAARLIREAAGWALDHKVGLALMGLDHVPVMSDEKAIYRGARASVDSHDVERLGSCFSREMPEAKDNRISRHIAVNILEALGPLFPPEIHEHLMTGLRGLEYGKSTGFLEPAKAYRKRQLQELQLQVKALAHAQFRFARGDQEFEARATVAEAYGKEPETLRQWRTRLPKTYRPLIVQKALDDAKRIGMRVRMLSKSDIPHASKRGYEALARRYSDQCLKTDGEKFRALDETSSVRRKSKPRSRR